MDIDVEDLGDDNMFQAARKNPSAMSIVVLSLFWDGIYLCRCDRFYQRSSSQGKALTISMRKHRPWLYGEIECCLYVPLYHETIGPVGRRPAIGEPCEIPYTPDLVMELARMVHEDLSNALVELFCKYILDPCYTIYNTDQRPTPPRKRG